MLQLPEPSAVVVPRSVVPSVSYSLMIEPGSALVPVMVGVVRLVMLSVLLLPKSDALAKSGALGAVGAVASIVIDRTGEGALVLPAASVTLYVKP